MEVGLCAASIADLPDELMVQVFSHLDPSQLNSCSRVCKRWSRLFREPLLWRHVYPTMWSRGRWSYRLACVGHVDQIPENELLWENTDVISSDPEFVAREQSWNDFYTGLERALDYLGIGVRVLDLSTNQFLYDSQFNTLISACPNLEELYANFTRISSAAFQVSSPGKWPRKLWKLSLSECTAITDRTVENLVKCWSRGGSSKAAGLRSLSLSGCSGLTDGSLELLSACPALLAGLEFLDLSGCRFHDGELLRTLVLGCALLQPENLYYCCNIATGPYQATANGCNNLDDDSRSCCVVHKN